MQNTWQRNSEEENKQSEPQEQFQSFVVTRPLMSLQLILYLSLVLAMVVIPPWAERHSIIIKNIPVLLNLIIICITYGVISYILSVRFISKKTVELYNNKLIIKSKTMEVIPFSKIKGYMEYYGMGRGFSAHVLKITLTDGKKIKLIADNDGMSKLVSAFNTKMDELIENNLLPIEKYDEQVIASYWGLRIGFVILAIFLLYVIYLGIFKHAYLGQ